MEAEHWQRVREVFRRALELEVEERGAFLDQTCGGDRSLRSEVELLLASLSAAGDFLEEPAGRLPGAGWEGQRIGSYELVKRIGRGGMGEVYLAVRADEEFCRRVAIKLLKPGEDGEEMVRRFRAERQILAGLDHPGIARLLDGGTTGQGLPYLVMEYIEGRPIDEYCDRRRLTTRQRLELFLAVCSAVQFAHQNLVVHRDLKPANILVAADGVPRLLDFGIAKLLNPELSPQRIQPTATALRIMTPEYASPEQVRADPITTATDVYSLGALLYKLLAGRPPFVVDTGSPVEMVKAICETEPQKLSQVATEGAAGVPGGPARLRRRLAGDVDNIVLMALRKEPARRYASVEHFADDVRRHLEGRPVVACGDSLAYRCSKFVQRHRVGVAAAAAVFVSTLLFGVAMTALNFRVVKERNRAEEMAGRWKSQLDHVAKTRERAEGIGQFLSQVVVSLEEGGTDVESFLKERAAELEEKYRGRPLERAAQLQTVGVVYRELGFSAEAESLLEESLDLRRRLLDDGDVTVADSLNELALLRQGMSEFAEAERFAREALALRRESLQEGHPDIAESLNTLGVILWYRGDLEAAEGLFLEALDSGRRTLGDDYPDILAIMNNLENISYTRADYATALRRSRQKLDLARARLGDSHPDLGRYSGNLATLLARCGRYDEAREHYQRALHIEQQSLTEGHPQVAMTWRNFAVMEMDLGDFPAAESLLEKALALQRSALGTRHVDVAATLRARGRLFYLTGRYALADQAYEEARGIDTELLGPDHQATASDSSGTAWVLSARSEHQRCEALARRAVDVLRAALPAGNRRIAAAGAILGGCLARNGSYEEAEEILDGSFVQLVKIPSTREVEGREALEHLRIVHRALGAPEKTAAYEDRLEEARRAGAEGCGQGS